MPTTDSPLRYPGGKSQLTPLVIDVLRQNKLFYGHYVEPFAGGAGIAWKLLQNNYVSHVHINDLDPAIYAFWHSVLNRTDDLCDRISSVRVCMTQWYKQRAIQEKCRPTLLDLGFSTFFLNRTNRSGIIGAGVIGGISQDGDYTLSCRFNKADLIRKIQRIGSMRERVSLYKRDALAFLTQILPDFPLNALVNLDPPYYTKGPELYRNHFTHQDHASLARAVARIRQYWMVTYDDTAETRALYARYPSFTQDLNYAAQVKRIGVELLVLDPRLVVPASLANAQRQVA